MIETSKLRSIRVLTAAALAIAGCAGTSGGEIPCVDDASCPNDYPVCGPAGKCIGGTSTTATTVAVVGAEGHAAADFVSGTVRVLVTARAASGVQSVKLAAGSTNFSASATSATPPLYAFDVNTAALPDGDATLTATLTAGDGTTAAATGTLHVDNAKPVIMVFTVANATSTTITAGKTAVVTASFTGGVSGTITSSAGGSVSIASGNSILVSPDVATTYSLKVISRSGVSVQSGSTGQPPDLSVGVVAPVSFTGNASVAPSAVQEGQSGNFIFTAPTFGSSAVQAVVKDGANATVGTIATSGGTVQVAFSAVPAGTTEIPFTVVVSNGATSPDTISIPLVVKVGAPPTISAFTASTTVTSGSSATLQATFGGGNGVITPGNIPINSGGSVVVAPASTTTYRLTVTNATTGATVSTGPTGPRPDVTITVVAPPVINTFAPSTVHTSSGASVTFSVTTTGATSDASVTTVCSSGSVAPFTITLSSGSGSASRNAATVTAQSTCTYTASVQNAAGTSAQTTAVITVEPLPSIASFVFAVNLTPSAFFAQGDTVVLNHSYDAKGGTATINGTPAGSSSTTFTNFQSTTVYTLTVTNLAGATAVASATANIAPGLWFQLSSANSEARKGSTVTALDDGRVLIAGGTNGSGTPLNTAVVCDATGACNSTGNSMQSPRAFHTAVKIPVSAPNNGRKILLAGGYTAAGPATPTTTAEFFDPSNNQFASTTDIKTAAVTTARARHIAVLLDSRNILVAGGTDGSSDLASAIKYDAGAATPAASDVAAMARTRASFTGTLLGTGNVLIVGGNVGDDTAELFNPTTSAFTNTGQVSTTTTEDKRGHTAELIGGASSNTGKVLISGGLIGAGAGSPSATQFLYDPAGGTFTLTASLRVARSSQAAISLVVTEVLICGGTDGSATLRSCERYDPNTGTQFPGGSMILPRRDFGLASVPSSLVEVLTSGGTDASATTLAEAYNSSTN